MMPDAQRQWMREAIAEVEQAAAHDDVPLRAVFRARRPQVGGQLAPGGPW